MVFSYLLSAIRRGLKFFHGNNGKAIIPGDGDVGCDPVEPIDVSSWRTSGNSSFSVRQKKWNSSNAGRLKPQHDAGIETPQLSKESSNTIGRMNVEEMGVDLICTPELGNSFVSSMTENSKVYEEVIKNESPPLHQEERKLQQFQDEIVVTLHEDGTSVQPSTARVLPEMTSEREMVSSSSLSCNDKPFTKNEISKGSLQLHERNEFYSYNPENTHYTSSFSVSAQNDNKTQGAVGNILFSNSDNGMDMFLNDSDDGGNCDGGGMEKGKQDPLKEQEIENEESGGNSGGYPSMMLQNLITDGYESFSSYSCDGEPEKQQPQLNSITDSKLGDHCNIVEIGSDSNEDESECMQDIDVYNWITTDKESIQCTGSWYKDLEESPKLEENFSSVVSPLPQQRISISPEGSKLGFVSSSPVSQSHCRLGLSPLRFPTSDSGSISPLLLSPQSAVPCVKETCDVSRKMASLPQQEQLSHPQVSHSDLCIPELIWSPMKIIIPPMHYCY